MKAILRGIERINYTSKKTGQAVAGLSLHLERDPLPAEAVRFAPDSSVVFTEYVPDSSGLVDKVRNFPMMSTVNLEYVPNGRFSSLVDINII